MRLLSRQAVREGRGMRDRTGQVKWNRMGREREQDGKMPGGARAEDQPPQTQTLRSGIILSLTGSVEQTSSTKSISAE